MKRFLLTILGALSMNLADAQVVASAGGTYSKWQDKGTSYRGGFFAGVSYVFQKDSFPILVDIGATLLNRGVNLEGGIDYRYGSEYNFRSSLYSVHVPFNIGFECLMPKNKFVMIPKIGIFVDYGMFGIISQSVEVSHLGGEHIIEGKYNDCDPYKDLSSLENGGIRNFNRFDWGARVAFDIYLSGNFLIDLGYEHSFSEIFRPDVDSYRSKFSSFSLGVGYVFLSKQKQKSVIIEI